MLDAQGLVNTMKKGLLATVAIVAFSVPSFAAGTAKTVGQSPLSFYLGYRDYEMSNRRAPACCWQPHEGYRYRSLDKGSSRDGFEC